MSGRVAIDADEGSLKPAAHVEPSSQSADAADRGHGLRPAPGGVNPRAQVVETRVKTTAIEFCTLRGRRSARPEVARMSEPRPEPTDPPSADDPPLRCDRNHQARSATEYGLKIRQSKFRTLRGLLHSTNAGGPKRLIEFSRRYGNRVGFGAMFDRMRRHRLRVRQFTVDFLRAPIQIHGPCK